ncbi:hypothetical protein GCM10023185_41240 [Hymenobacter saemangeumensis]|uniref:OmpA-like domain-containing protein n=1 Tax=Hymenobacter saemangeumensis TaxID=1084522 RepID=A0ABP8IRC4_9BACT
MLEDFGENSESWSAGSSAAGSKTLYTQGIGDTQPVAPNDTDENKHKNRRVEFVIVGR